MLPNFLCVGAAKSATTSLYRYLKQHPEIFLPEQKELHYFSHLEYTSHINGPGDEIVLDLCVSDLESYKSYFNGSEGYHAVGEISPSYFIFPEVPERIYNLLGDIKIIIMLRNPLDRAYSNYWNMVRAFGEKESFYDALLKEDDRLAAGWNDFWGYTKLSMYSDMLRRYIERFGRDNVHVILYEKFTSDTRLELNKVFLFLGVSTDVDIDIGERFNTSITVQNRLVGLVSKVIHPFSGIGKLMLGKNNAKRFKNFLLGRAAGLAKSHEMTRKEADLLVGRLSDDISSVEKELNINTGWLDAYK